MAVAIVGARLDAHSGSAAPVGQQAGGASVERNRDESTRGVSASTWTHEVGQPPSSQGGVKVKAPSQHGEMAPPSVVPKTLDPRNQGQVRIDGPGGGSATGPIHINIVSLAARVTELAGCRADDAINRKFEEYKQSSASMKPGFWGAVGRLVITPFRLNTYKAAWLRMTADAKRASLCTENRAQIYAELAHDEQKQIVLQRFSELEQYGASQNGFGERRINNRDGSSGVERRMRSLALQYLSGKVDDSEFEGRKASILRLRNVRDSVDNALPQLKVLRNECETATDRAQRANELLSHVSFGVWEDSCAAGEKLRQGIGDRLVAACHGSRILGSVPGVAFVTATAVSVGVYLAKGGFGTRQLAVGAATSVGTSLALGAAIASVPVLSGLVVGTGVAAVFAYLRKGKELKKDLHQVRTEKVLGRRNSATESLSPKDALFQKKYLNPNALNVGEQIRKLRQSLDVDAVDVAKLIGETEAALLLQNDPRERANTLNYSDSTEIARERLELIQALVEARQKVENGTQGAALETELGQQLEEERHQAFEAFIARFVAAQREVDGSFAKYRRWEQMKAGATTFVVGSAMGGLFYGAGRSIEAMRGYLSPAVTTGAAAPLSQALNVPHIEEPATVSIPEPSPAVSAPVVPTEEIVAPQSKPLPFDMDTPPKGLTLQDDGSIVANLKETDEKVLAALRDYQPNTSSVEIQGAIADRTISRSITQSIGHSGADNGVKVGTLAKEFHFDNGTRTVDGNESGLRWGGAGQRGVSKDGSVVYDIKSMFKKDSFYLQGGKKISINVDDIVKNSGARTPAQGQMEMILRLDAKNPNEIICIPVQPDGRIVIPEEVKQVAYRVNSSGQTEYLGWKASVGLVREVDGKITFGEISTDFGSKQLNGSKVIETIPGKKAVMGLVFPKPPVEAIQESRPTLPAVEPAPITQPPVVEAPVVQKPVVQVPVVEPVAVVEAVKPLELHNWFFPISWGDRRESFSSKGSNEEQPSPPQMSREDVPREDVPRENVSRDEVPPPAPIQPREQLSLTDSQPTDGNPNQGNNSEREWESPTKLAHEQAPRVPSLEQTLSKIPEAATPAVPADPPKRERKPRAKTVKRSSIQGSQRKVRKAGSGPSTSADATPGKPPRKKKSEAIFVTVERPGRGGGKKRHSGWISEDTSK